MKGAAVAAALLLWGCATTRELQGAAGYLRPLNLESVGTVHAPPETLTGKVVMVTFMATWCLPCLQELPDLVALQQRYAEQGFTVVMIGMDLEGALVLQPFAEHYDLPFPLLVADGHLRSGQSAYGQISILPTTFVIGRDGTLRAQLVGIGSASDLDEMVRLALAR